jgi:D-alanyl-lipoteichoic acid acyltransferase DltB (MBOAT superfamily)
MTFVSLDYLVVFLPIVVGLYYLFRQTVVANIIILSASYIFYAAGAIWYLLPLVFTSLLDFVVGILLSRTDRARSRRVLLIASLTANLGLLALFKYTPWLIGNLNLGFAAVGLDVALPALVVTLPPGISFYTFQTMSYTIEVYRREMQPTRHLIDYMAFVTFWPHLVAGPIMRASNLLRQLERTRPVISADEARYALVLIAWGLFKKIALADNFGQIVDSIEEVLRAKIDLPGAGLLFGYAFAGQIYCDFSAYTDIARGSAKLINVELIRNFHTPYFSASPTEFWRRWHISLSTWLRDYLYIPLGGNRYGRRMEYRNLMITMTLGGLWHGAGILFILWGAWHGLMLILYRLFPIHQYLEAQLGLLGKWLSILITFHIVCFGWILFRAQSDLIVPLLRSIGEFVFLKPTYQSYGYGFGVFVLGSVVLVTDYLGYRKGVEFPDLFKSLNPYLSAGLIAACYFGIMVLGKREGAQFIYFQF